jgi:hypothetical protein
VQVNNGVYFVEWPVITIRPIPDVPFYGDSLLTSATAGFFDCCFANINADNPEPSLGQGDRAIACATTQIHDPESV